MKNLIITTALLGLASCGQPIQKKYYETTEIVEVEEKIIEVQEFEGRYLLSNNSFIELYQTDYHVIISGLGQILTTVNPENNTFGELPKITGNYVPVNDIIRISKNLNYKPGNDIEEDESGNNITGKRRTDITIEKVDGKLQITYEIYSNKINANVNYIVATRTLIQE